MYCSLLKPYISYCSQPLGMSPMC